MTLVATFCFDGAAIIIGDMLVTYNEGADRKSVEIPTVGPVSKIIRKRKGVDGLAQKVCIVADNVVIGYAGSVLPARALIIALRRLASQETITLKMLENFFQLRIPLLKQVAIVGLISTEIGEGKYSIEQFNIGGQVAQTKSLGQIACAGFGVPLLQAACAADLVDPNGFPKLSRPSAAICKVLSICGHLVDEENAGATSIVDHSTGGFYEIAYFDGSRFKKLDITFMVWRMTVQNGILVFTDPQIVLKSAYIGDIHYVNCARLTEFSEDAPVERKFDLHGIFPPWDISTNSVSPTGQEIGFQSRLTQHQISVYQKNKRVSYLSIVETAPSSANLLVNDEEFRFEYKDEFISSLKRIFAKA